MVPKFLKMYTPWLKHLRVCTQSRQFTNHMEVYGVSLLRCNEPTELQVVWRLYLMGQFTLLRLGWAAEHIWSWVSNTWTCSFLRVHCSDILGSLNTSDVWHIFFPNTVSGSIYFLYLRGTGMEHFLSIGGLCLIVTFKDNSYEHTKSHQALSKLNWMLHNCESDN